MPESPTHLAERFRSEGEKTLAFFHGLTPEQWEHPVYSDGPAWTVRQVFAHFVSAEESFSNLADDILQGGLGAPEGFDIDRFNEHEVADLGGVSIPDLMKRFSIARHRIADLVAQMGETDLTRQGRHPFLGLAPLEDILKLIYRHNQIHLRDLRRVLAV